MRHLPSKMNNFPAYFAGKNILVTGAAGALGKALTGTLHKYNANVTALSRSAEKLETLKAQFPKIKTISVDLSDWNTTRRVLEEIEEPFDGVVNNAGIIVTGSIMKTTPDQLKTVIDLNLKAAINVTQVLASKMISVGKHGSFVNISTLMSHRVSNLAASYSLSKAALNMATRLFAAELGPHQIRVNAVSPGGFESESFFRVTEEYFGNENTMAIRNKRVLRRTPLRRPLLEVEEVVNATLFLLSGAVPMLTGQILVIDGGFTLT